MFLSSKEIKEWFLVSSDDGDGLVFERVTVRVPEQALKDARKWVAFHHDRYGSLSHYVRAAVARLNRLHDGAVEVQEDLE